MVGNAKVVGGMAMSLDGFINDRSGSVARLYAHFDALLATEYLQDSMRTTGAVVMGRHAFDMANGDYTGYEYQAPIFVLTHHPPQEPTKGQNDRLTVTFVGDGIESAIARAKAAAGDDKVVTIVGGANTIQQSLDAGLLDELHIDLVPVLLGGGQRLFETGRTTPVEFEQVSVTQYAWFTVLQFRALKGTGDQG